MLRTHLAGELRKELAGETVTLTGWVARRRDHGGVIFIDLRDRSGVAQVVFRETEVAERAHDLRSEYCVKVTGVVEPRPEGSANPNLPPARLRSTSRTWRYSTSPQRCRSRLMIHPPPVRSVRRPA